MRNSDYKDWMKKSTPTIVQREEYMGTPANVAKQSLLNKVMVDKDTVCIEDWEDLDGLNSDTHYIETDGHRGCCRAKNPKQATTERYLSTHTFYKEKYVESTVYLQECGFNVVLNSWG
jgi:hypothetical protein